MRLRIHHGAAQIGGNCIELRAEGQSLLLDLGLPLQAEPVLPDLPGLTGPDPQLLGVVLSHPHLDHYGLLPEVRSNLPVWLGEGACRLLEAAAPFTPSASLPQALRSYRAEETFEIGPFRITPYLMDHSAHDAHALLVEAGGKRVFYSGDFRGHGPRAHIFEDFLTRAPKDIDLLLMEGTTLSRGEGERASEAVLEVAAAEVMRQTPGLTLLSFAGQNLDRFTTLHAACRAAGRTLVIDAYLAALLEAAHGSDDGSSLSPDLRIYLPQTQKRMIVRDKRFDLINPYRARRIFAEELASRAGELAIVFRSSMIRDFARAELAGGAIIYSLWPGYLERDREDLRDWARGKGVTFHILHSSGHAHADDLRRMAQALQPTRLTPIHTNAPHAYEALWPSVELATNGAWIYV